MLLILHPYKFTLFHKKRIELELLKKQLNQKIEIHDLGGILNKKWGEAFLTKEEKKVKKFYSIFRWIKYFKNLNKKNLVIISFISPNSVKSIIIHYFLLSAKVKIIKIYSSGVYHSDLSYKSFVNLKSITKKLKSVFYDYKKLIFYINMKFYEQIFKFFKFKKNIILFTGTQKINPFPNQSDKYYNFHSYDYSEYLRKKNQCNISKKYIIFLDSSGPHFTYD